MKYAIVDYLFLVATGMIENVVVKITDGEPPVIEGELMAECHESIEWMVKTLKWQFDNQKSAFGQHSEGGYEPKLQKAIDLLERLRKYREKE